MSITKEDIGELRNSLIALNGVVLRLLDKLPDDQEPSNTNKRDFRDELDRLFHSSSTGSMGIADIKAPDTAEVCSSARISRTPVTSNTPGCERSDNKCAFVHYKNQIRIYGPIKDGILEGDEFVVVESGSLSNCIIRTDGSVHNASITNCQLGVGSVTVHGSKAVMSDCCINSGGNLQIWSSGASAVHTTVYGGGYFRIAHGAEADFVDIKGGGSVCVSYTGCLTSAVVSSGGSLFVTSAGKTVQHINVLKYGNAHVGDCMVGAMNGYGVCNKLTVGSGATVCHMACNDGDVCVLGKVQNCNLQNADLEILRDGTVHSALADSGARINIGWHASSWRCSVRTGAKIYIGTSGSLTELAATDANTSVYVSAGGYINGGRIGEKATCVNDGHINSIDVSGYGTKMSVTSGGTVNITRVYQSGFVEVQGGAGMNAIDVFDGDIVVHSGGSVAEVTLREGWLHVMSGAVVSKCIQSGGTIIVSSDGICKVENRGSGSIETLRGGYSYVMHTEENDK